MSFGEERLDPHGECAAEIHSLQQKLETNQQTIEILKQERDTLSWDRAKLDEKLRLTELQNSELREALKKVDEILVPLLHEQGKRDRHQFLAEFSEVHDPRGIIREALNQKAGSVKERP